MNASVILKMVPRLNYLPLLHTYTHRDLAAEEHLPQSLVLPSPPVDAVPECAVEGYLHDSERALWVCYDLLDFLGRKGSALSGVSVLSLRMAAARICAEKSL